MHIGSDPRRRPAQEDIGFAEYAAQTEEWFAGLLERGDGVSIDFRFTERLASEDLASERGIYRITATRSGEEDHIFYGRFHTFVRKEAGRWRIAVDYDSKDAGTLTAEPFAAGAEIDDVERFTAGTTCACSIASSAVSRVTSVVPL